MLQSFERIIQPPKISSKDIRIDRDSWLEAHFGAGSLWKPTESELPARLTDAATRRFLTTVGFPLVQCTGIQWDPSGLKKSVDAGVELYAYDADEIFGRRWADDDSPPVNFCYNFGCVGGDVVVMVDAEDGLIIHYDLGGYGDQADRGLIAGSLPSLLVLLGTINMVIKRIGEAPQGLSCEAFENLRRTIFCQVYKIMADYDDCFEGDSRFWNGLLE
ncbi:hypothetical protein N7455_004543 [Penicillium solitum]|uniref:uncharacterized protein n=1 Tax=Penicillium solitum TaxID=60172 RepID=UPI0032C3FD61|nr:hypothetical protein N7455_004543 [Penicillium solitum]